ncbi:tetratricopeptide repeat protein [Actinomadura madurae]|uniref:tetratricopeptide repeat protein n=2 Tax=Actinomadura madurae TaxID=1993 RepID=UPI0020D2558B|nr:tetratricopeptide repeat protein [Actinomadura madurae]MCP9952832.1 tetratricopeptide repeat protein [Actinomadura madurae]
MYERNGDLDGAVAATERMLAGAGTSPAPWLRLLAHSRLSELLAQLDQGERALHHLHTSLELMERHRWPDTFGLMWALAAAHISLGQFDEAEQWLDRSLLQGPGQDDEYGTATFNLGARAEIAIARGDVDTGLRLWREAVDRLSRDPNPMVASDLDPWTLEAHCVTVVAHAATAGSTWSRTSSRGCRPSSPLCSPTGRSRCRPSSWTCPSAAVCCSPSPRRNSPDPMSGRTVGRGPRARSRSRSGSTTSGRSSRRCRPRPLAAPPRTPTGGVCRRGVGVRRPRP